MSEMHDIPGSGDSRLPAGGGDPEGIMGPAGSSTLVMSTEGYTFDTLVGFDAEIGRLRESGVLEGADPAYLEFVEQMRRQHGLYDEPVGPSLLFRSDVREDADRLMLAVANEMRQPTVRLRIVDTAEDSQALCVMATPGVGADGFEDRGTLVIEGIDAFSVPEGFGFGTPGFDMLMPGRRADAAGSLAGMLKMVSLVRSAAANPRVAVLASACDLPDADSPVMQLLGPMQLFEVPAPDAHEREAIWEHLMDRHVSMSALDRYELVRLSGGMPRCDIFAAAHEAVVQAYRASLDRRVYVPVTRGNLLDKIAAYQPLDSAEYHEIEDSIVEDFLAELDRYEHGAS